MILPAVQGNACSTAAAGAEPARMQGGRCACSGLSMRTYDGITAMGFGSAPLRCAASRRGGGGRRRRGKASKILTVFVSRDRSGSRGEIRVLQKKNKAVLLESSTSSCLFGFLQGRNATQDQCFLRSSSKNEKPQALSRHARSCTGCAMN